MVRGAPITFGEQVQMIIEAFFGLVLAITGGNDTPTDPATMIYRGLVTTNKIIQKEKNNEMDDSIHEEKYQITKDILEELRK